MPLLSVILPAFNEAELLPATLGSLQANVVPHEILVVDGGSTDSTPKIAAAAGARVLRAPGRGRACQMNFGARHAGGETLLFLHADTRVGPNALAAISDALAVPQVVGGGFARRFDSRSAVLRVTAPLGELRSRWLRWFYGDQGIFIRRTLFEGLGGFAEVPVFEDVDLTRRMALHGQVVTLRCDVISSARRFAARGPLVTTLSDCWLTVRYLAGTDPRRLARGRTVEPRMNTNEPSAAKPHPLETNHE